MLMKWNDTYSVNVSAIDAQHKKLFDMVNQLLDAMQKQQAQEVILEIINGLAGYAVTHFEFEEKYFKQYNFADTEAHIKEHKAFIEKVSEFKKGYEQNPSLLTIQVLHFLRDWLKNHIKGTDQKYTSCFNQNGLT